MIDCRFLLVVEPRTLGNSYKTLYPPDLGDTVTHAGSHVDGQASWVLFFGSLGNATHK